MSTRGKMSKSKTVVKKRKVSATERVHFTAAPPPHPAMYFNEVGCAIPDEGDLLLVRLKNGVYRYGMVVQGRFAAHDYYSDAFVTFAHPGWITHWLKIIPPVPFSTAKAEAQTAQPECLPPEHVESLEDAGATHA